MSGRTVIVMILAILCGASAATGVFLMRRQVATTTVDPATAAVTVALTEIPRGAVVNASMVSVRQWPMDLAPPLRVADPAELIGRTALVGMVAGEPVVDVKLASRDAGHGLAALIPPGRRAYTIQTPRVASNVAGFAMPSNFVDVLLTLRGTSNDNTGGGSSVTLLQAVEILAVDAHLDAPADNKVDPQSNRSVTLLVTPDEATLLDLGQNMGTLTLSLRNPEDLQTAQTSPATLTQLRYTQRKPTFDLQQQLSLLSGHQAKQTPSPDLRAATANAVGALQTVLKPVVPEALPIPSDQTASGDDANSASGRRASGTHKRPTYVEIQTFRGRHSGRVLTQLHEQ